jgi:hypothetical protein
MATTTTTTSKTEQCKHGLLPEGCAACRKASKASKGGGSLTLATVPATLTLVDKTATLTPHTSRNGAVRAVLAATNVRPDADGRLSTGLRFPDPSLVFGTNDDGDRPVPEAATVVVGPTTPAGKLRKGSVRVSVPLGLVVKDGRPTSAREGTVPLDYAGEAMLAYVRVTVQGDGGWYVTASVRPGRPSAPTVRPASAALDGNPFA